MKYFFTVIQHRLEINNEDNKDDEMAQGQDWNMFVFITGKYPSNGVKWDQNMVGMGLEHAQNVFIMLYIGNIH